MIKATQLESVTHLNGVEAIDGKGIELIDANGNEIVKEVVEGSKTRDTLSISELTKHAAVGNIEVYGSVLSPEEMAAAMTNLANPAPTPSVPEPTTATLSLLALAGLAARRRRR